VAVWRGDFAAALSAFEERQAVDVASGMKHPNARIWTVEYADALAGVGRRSEAIAMVRELVELSSVLGGVSGRGYHQLTLGRLTGEVADLERAVAILEPSPFRWYAARAQLELGAALRRDGQRVKAREHLRLALDYAERNRVRHFSARAREELRLAGAKPHKLVLTGVEALTPAEHRIVLLAAEGRTNKEIAQHLFLTVKTIEATLVRAYRKLGVSTRGQLAQVLAQPAPA
jgi:DNA-binding CsgD family transcriptional regulator